MDAAVPALLRLAILVGREPAPTMANPSFGPYSRRYAPWIVQRCLTPTPEKDIDFPRLSAARRRALER